MNSTRSDSTDFTGKGNKPWKVGMYPAKELCDLKLKEIAEHFGTASYGTVGWACHGVCLKERTQSFAIVSSIRRIYQQKI